MNKLFIFALIFPLAFCSKTSSKPTYVYTHNAERYLVRTEMMNGLANGRITIYGLDNEIKVTMHVKDSVLTGKSYSFYDDGNISRITNYVQGLEQGRRYDFYKNNQIASIITYKDDKKTGPAYTFYSNGGIEARVNFLNDQAFGDFLDFYEKPKNHLRRRVQYNIVRGKQYGNGRIDYSPDGVITKRIGQLDFLFDKKIYSTKGSIIVAIRLIGPRFKRIRATLADFDAGFNCNDSTTERIFYGRNHIVQIVVHPKSRGLNCVRGYITDYDSISPVKVGVLYQMKEKNIYFQQKYLVK